MTQTITVRCKAYSTESTRPYRVQVESDGTVRVWDSVAGHYTTCHSLSPRSVARIVRLARQS